MKRSKPQGLNDLITEARLRTEAGERAFARGAAYFESGAVTDLVVSDETINARVVGGDEYAVQLWNDDGALGYSCTCPVGDDGVFCKHGVAAGLAWLAGQQSSVPGRRHKDDLAGVREWLAAAPRARLEELLLEQALDDPALRSRLDSQAARIAAKKDTDIKSLIETVGKALSVGGFVDYYGMSRFLEHARPAADLLAGLLEDGHAEAARELSPYALKRGIVVYQRTDDSGGGFADGIEARAAGQGRPDCGFGELLHEIAGLHLKACRAARARRLRQAVLRASDAGRLGCPRLRGPRTLSRSGRAARLSRARREGMGKGSGARPGRGRIALFHFLPYYLHHGSARACGE